MTDKMILGNGAVYSTDSNETGLNNNVIVCGTSGCGKTMSILEPRLLETYESSLIVTVTKRKLVDKYTHVFKERGYDVLDLNFVSPHLSSAAYDPLLFIKNTGDINSFAEAVVCEKISKGSVYDPYWYEAAMSLLSAEIAYVMATSNGTRPNMADVINLHRMIKIEEGITESIRIPLDDNFNALEKRGDSYSVFALSCWRTFSSLPLRTASCVFSELSTRGFMIFWAIILLGCFIFVLCCMSMVKDVPYYNYRSDAQNAYFALTILAIAEFVSLIGLIICIMRYINAPNLIKDCPNCGNIYLIEEGVCSFCGSNLNNPNAASVTAHIHSAGVGSVVNTSCPRCGTVNRSNAEFCTVCGYHFVKSSTESVACPQCGTISSSDAKFCLKCGHRFAASSAESDTKFCMYCGSKIPSESVVCPQCGVKQQ